MDVHAVPSASNRLLLSLSSLSCNNSGGALRRVIDASTASCKSRPVMLPVFLRTMPTPSPVPNGDIQDCY